VVRSTPTRFSLWQGGRSPGVVRDGRGTTPALLRLAPRGTASSRRIGERPLQDLVVFDSVPNSPRRYGSGPIGGTLRCGLDLARLVHGPKPRDPRLNSRTVRGRRSPCESIANPRQLIRHGLTKRGSASRQIDLRLRTDMRVMFCGLLARRHKRGRQGTEGGQVKGLERAPSRGDDASRADPFMRERAT
jgi:hypothetical protein